MFLALPVAAGIVIAQLAGGDLRKLAALRFRRIGLFYLAMGFQVLAFPFPWLPWQTSDGIARALWLLSYGLLVLAAFLNRDVPGVPVIAVGMISNVIAVVANGGHMPALPSALRSAHKSYHVQYNSAAMSSPRFPWLVDRWAVPRWLHVGNVFSVGDVVIGVGAFMLVWSAMGARASFTRGSRRPVVGCRRAPGGAVSRSHRRGRTPRRSRSSQRAARTRGDLPGARSRLSRARLATSGRALGPTLGDLRAGGRRSRGGGGGAGRSHAGPTTPYRGLRRAAGATRGRVELLSFRKELWELPTE